MVVERRTFGEDFAFRHVDKGAERAGVVCVAKFSQIEDEVKSEECRKSRGSNTSHVI